MGLTMSIKSIDSYCLWIVGHPSEKQVCVDLTMRLINLPVKFLVCSNENELFLWDLALSDAIHLTSYCCAKLHTM